MKTTLLSLWQNTSMQLISGGDADICTKNGRLTRVTLSMSQPAVEQLGGHGVIRSHVVLDIEEARSNYTHLQMDADLKIPFPEEMRNLRVLGAREFTTSFHVFGKNHRWIPVQNNSVNWIQSLFVKVDGPGDDADGNAGMMVNLAIPVEFDA